MKILTSNKPYFFLYLMALLTVFFWIGVGPLSSEPDRTSSLRQEFFRLRNIDSTLTRKEEWRALITKYEEFVARDKLDNSSGVLLFDLGVINQLYFENVSQSKAVLEQAIDYFDSFATQFSKHDLADEALLKAGDLAFRLNDDPEQAREYYQRLLQDFPNVETYAIAQRRIQEIDGDYEEESPKSGEQVRAVGEVSKVILLDPGHGGEDYGAVGSGGMREKDITLSIALEVERLLTSSLPVKVVLTRRSDKFVPLLDRTELANQNEADVFLSLHANASTKKDLSGFEVFYLDNTGDQSTKRLAERENRALSLHSDSEMDLSFILSDLIQGAKIVESEKLAKDVYDSSLAYLKERYPTVKGLGVKKAPFYVLMGAHMPCILIEMFFLDNKLDSRNLASPRFRSDLSAGIAQGLARFLGLEDAYLKAQRDLNDSQEAQN